MRKTVLLTVSLPLFSAVSYAQDEMNMWPGVAPGSETWTQQETEYSDDGLKAIRNVVTPTLTIFRPEASAANRTAVIVAPGGGFRMLSFENEGTQVAQWLADRGYTAFVLDDDLALDFANLSIYKAWRKAGKSTELHIYEKGEHGFGMKNRDCSSTHG